MKILNMVRGCFNRRKRPAPLPADEIYRAALEQALLGMFVTDAEGQLLEANSHACQLLGWTREQILGRNLRDFLPADESRRAREALGRLEAGETLFGEHTLQQRDGSQRSVEVSRKLLPDGRVLAIVRDVTQSKAAETALREAKEYAENLIHTASVMIIGLDATGRIEVFNETAQRITGYTWGEAHGANWFDFLVPRERYPEIWVAFSRLRNGSLPLTLQNPILTKSGQERLITWSNNAIHRQGAIIGSISFGIDLTESQRTQEALRQSEEQYRLLAETSSDMISRHRADGTVVFVSPACRTLLGFEPHELLGMAAGDYVHPQDIDRLWSSIQAQAAHSDAYRSEHRMRTRSGAYVWVETLGRFIKNPGTGQLQEILCFTRDITERKQADVERARMAERLVHVREDVQRHIAREIHDTITQNLVALHMQLQALRKTPDQRAAPAALDDAIALANQSTEQLRTLSYLLHPPVLDDLGLTGALHDFALGFERRSGIRVECDFATDLISLPSEVERVLYRVVQESLHNIHRHANSPTAAIRLWHEDDDVWLEIADAGRGILPDRLQTLQQPFTGMGVGISGMRERLGLLGGRLNVHSNDRGTTVQAIVPVTAPPGLAHPQSSPSV